MEKLTIYVPQPSHPGRAKYDELMLALARKGFGIENTVFLFPQITNDAEDANIFRALTITLEDLEKLSQREVPMQTLRFKGEEIYAAICDALAHRSCSFKCTPLPDDEYEVSFKPNEGIEELIKETIRKWL